MCPMSHFPIRSSWIHVSVLTGGTFLFSHHAKFGSSASNRVRVNTAQKKIIPMRGRPWEFVSENSTTLYCHCPVGLSTQKFYPDPSMIFLNSSSSWRTVDDRSRVRNPTPVFRHSSLPPGWIDAEVHCRSASLLQHPRFGVGLRRGS